MAAYGGALRVGKTPKQAVAYLTTLYRKHVVAQQSSAREALQTFLAGKGDVLLSYENEAIRANQKGQNVNYVSPKATILIENPIAVTTTTKHAAQANAFVKFLYTPQAQTLVAQTGYRPVLKSVARKFNFTLPKQLFTISYVGRLEARPEEVLRSAHGCDGEDRAGPWRLGRYRFPRGV